MQNNYFELFKYMYTYSIATSVQFLSRQKRDARKDNFTECVLKHYARKTVYLYDVKDNFSFKVTLAISTSLQQCIKKLERKTHLNCCCTFHLTVLTSQMLSGTCLGVFVLIR